MSPIEMNYDSYRKTVIYPDSIALKNVSELIHRAARLSSWPSRGFLTRVRVELGSCISLLVSHVGIISRAQAALPLCSRPHADLHRRRAALAFAWSRVADL